MLFVCRKVFFRRWFEVLDLLFITLHTLLTISYIILFNPDTKKIPLWAVLVVRYGWIN